MKELFDYTEMKGISSEMLSLLVFILEKANGRIPSRFFSRKQAEIVQECLDKGYLLNDDVGNVVVTRKFEMYLRTLFELSKVG